MPRLFYGIEIPTAIKDGLRAAQVALKQGTVTADGWSNPDLFHVTVLFLGVVEDSVHPALERIGQQVASEVGPFSLTIGGYDVFPRNKVLFAHIDGNPKDKLALQKLHLHLKNAIADRLQLPMETRAYKPHLTIARKVRQAHGVEKQRPTVRGAVFEVSSLCLFESTRENGCLVYPILARFPLGITPSVLADDLQST